MYLGLLEKDKSHVKFSVVAVFFLGNIGAQYVFREKIGSIVTSLLYIYMKESFESGQNLTDYCPQHEQYRYTCQVCILLFADKLVRSDNPEICRQTLD